MERQPEIITGAAGKLRERLAAGSVEYSKENPASLAAVRHVHAGYKELLHDETTPLMDLTFRCAQFFKLKLTRRMLKRLSRPSAFAGILNLVFVKKLKS
ncbi:MAG: hypothetical protein WCV67_21445 [Victivallaceae bacterium]|jgi:hypothetical protein